MKKLFLIGGLVVSVLFSAVSTSATDSPYVLDMTENERNIKTLHLKYKKSGRIIWTRKIYSHNPRIIWAKNRRSLAVEGGIRSILVWREGYRLRNFALPNGGDDVMDVKWSQNNRRLLVLCSKSLGADYGKGELFCLRLGKWPYYAYRLVTLEAAEMGWRNSGTVFYRRMLGMTQRMGKKVYLWKVW